MTQPQPLHQRGVTGQSSVQSHFVVMPNISFSASVIEQLQISSVRTSLSSRPIQETELSFGMLHHNLWVTTCDGGLLTVVDIRIDNSCDRGFSAVHINRSSIVTTINAVRWFFKECTHPTFRFSNDLRECRCFLFKEEEMKKCRGYRLRGERIITDNICSAHQTNKCS